MENLTAYFKNRMDETSTLRGVIIFLFGLGGYSLSETDALTLVAAGQILAGTIGALMPDKAN